MPRQPNDDGQPPSPSPPNELRAFFKGPKLLLILKLPLLIIGSILFITYQTVKFALETFIRIINSAIKSLPSLFESILLYLVLFYDKVPVFTRYVATLFYEYIFKPISFCLDKYILPTIHHVIKWTERKTGSLCLILYRSIFQPIAKFCYNHLFIRFHEWIGCITTALNNTVCWLFTQLRSMCLWIWSNILHPLCAFMYVQVFLSFYRTIVGIPSFIYNEVLPATSRFVKRLVHTIWCSLHVTFLLIKNGLLRATEFIADTSLLLYEHILLPCYDSVLRFIMYFIDELLEPFCQCTLHIGKVVFRYSLKIVIKTILQVSNAIIHSYRAVLCTFKRSLLFFYRTLTKICSFIYNAVLPATGGFLKHLAKTSWCWSNRIFLFIDRGLLKVLYFISDASLMLYDSAVRFSVYFLDELLEPLYQWTIHIGQLVFRYLLRVVFKTILHVSNAIIHSYRAVLFISRHYLLYFYQTLTKICAFIYNEVLPATGRFLEHLIHTSWCGLHRILLLIEKGLLCAIYFVRNVSTMLYRHVLLPFYNAVLRFFVYALDQIFEPFCQWTTHVGQVVFRYLLKTIVISILHVANAAIHSYHAVLFISKNYLLYFYQILTEICAFIYNEVSPAIGRFVKWLVHTIWCWLNRISLLIKKDLLEAIHFTHDTSIIIYRHVLLPSYAATLTFTLYVINDMMKPSGQRISHIAKALSNGIISLTQSVRYFYRECIFFCKEYGLPFCHTTMRMCQSIYQDVFLPIIRALYEIGEVCYHSVLQPLGNAMSAMPQLFVSIFGTTRTMVHDAVHAIRLAIAILGATVASMVRSITEYGRFSNRTRDAQN